MKKKTLIILCTIFLLGWFILTGISWKLDMGFGTIATLLGIAIMFALTGIQNIIKN